MIRKCAQFPNGEYDDWVDTVTQAIIWFDLEFRDDEEPAREERKRPIAVNRKVSPIWPPKRDLRPRQYLKPHEVDRLMVSAAKAAPPSFC